VVNATIADPEPVIKGTIHNELGHQRSARLARNYKDGQVHLTYCGNPYTLTEEGSVQYCTDSTYVEGQVHFFVSTIQQAFEDGVTHINVSDGDSLKMTQEKINAHICGVALLQQFSLKAGLKHFGKKDEEGVTSELTQMHKMAMYEPVEPETLS
jgi:hypothetical protein